MFCPAYLHILLHKGQRCKNRALWWMLCAALLLGPFSCISAGGVICDRLLSYHLFIHNPETWMKTLQEMIEPQSIQAHTKISQISVRL